MPDELMKSRRPTDDQGESDFRGEGFRRRRGRGCLPHPRRGWRPSKRCHGAACGRPTAGGISLDAVLSRPGRTRGQSPAAGSHRHVLGGLRPRGISRRRLARAGSRARLDLPPVPRDAGAAAPRDAVVDAAAVPHRKSCRRSGSRWRAPRAHSDLVGRAVASRRGNGPRSQDAGRRRSGRHLRRRRCFLGGRFSRVLESRRGGPGAGRVRAAEQRVRDLHTAITAERRNLVRGARRRLWHAGRARGRQ